MNEDSAPFAGCVHRWKFHPRVTLRNSVLTTVVRLHKSRIVMPARGRALPTTAAPQSLRAPCRLRAGSRPATPEQHTPIRRNRLLAGPGVLGCPAGLENRSGAAYVHVWVTLGAPVARCEPGGAANSIGAGETRTGPTTPKSPLRGAKHCGSTAGTCRGVSRVPTHRPAQSC